MIKQMMKTVYKNITIIDVLEAINMKFGDITALQIKTKEGTFRKLSYIELGMRTVDVSSTLIKLGIQKGDRVAILSESRPEWAVSYFGVVSCGGIVVPVDIKLSDKEIEFILRDSGAKCLFVSGKHLASIDKLRPVLPDLKNVVVLDDSDRADLIHLKDLKLKEGEEKNRAIYPEDTALIVYTSGTTGFSKGVEITYRSLLFQVMAITDIVRYSKKDNFLSILPLNHMLEITGGLIAPLYAGSCVTYCESLKPPVILDLMKETHTTTMISVPLVLKMMYDGMLRKVEKLPSSQQKLFHACFAVSKFFLRFNIRIGRVLFRSLHKEFGGQLKGFVSGGAPLHIDVETGFNVLGFRILQGYGLTETAPVISVNTFTHNRFGSVGRPLPGVEVRILKENESAPDGEILVRGPNVMKGYYKNPEKTGEVIKDGWLHTGDIGYLDKGDYLHISGRKRNLIVLGAGKKVFPEEVEEVLSKSPLIKELCIIGRIADKGVRKGCEEVYAVIVPNADAIGPDKGKEDAAVKECISAELSRLGQDLAEYKQPVDFEIWRDELPKTATRKIRRNVVSEKVNVKQ